MVSEVYCERIYFQKYTINRNIFRTDTVNRNIFRTDTVNRNIFRYPFKHSCLSIFVEYIITGNLYLSISHKTSSCKNKSIS